MPDPLLSRGALARLGFLALIALLFAVPQLARAESLDPWLGHDAAKCAPLSGLDKVAKVATLTPAQFEFVRALYIALPPISHQLPPGDHAVLAIANDSAMAALVDGAVSCARLELAAFMVEMLMAVGRGEVGRAGDAL